MARKVRWETACLLANLGLLGAVVWACRLGLDAHRLRTAAIFLIVGTASSVYSELLFHFCKALARRQRETDIPRGVRLRMPLWLAAGGPLAMLSVCAPVAALAGGLGSGQAGLGVLFAVAALTATVGYFVMRHSCRSLAIQADGLRLYLLGITFLVPWKSLASVHIEGQAAWKMVQLTFFETTSALGSVEPNTPRARQRAALALYGSDGLPGQILLDQWAAGIDAPVLARAIRAGMTGSATGALN